MMRGINVGGKNLIKMTSLQALYESLGFVCIKTYIQSGNVIFQHDKSSTRQLGIDISKKVMKNFGFDIPVIVREKAELKRILAHNPFLNKKDIDKLHITFLSDTPDKKLSEKIESDSYLPDEYFIHGKEIYLFCPDGYGRTKLSNNFFENKLYLNATTRNLKTLKELVRISDSI